MAEYFFREGKADTLEKAKELAESILKQFLNALKKANTALAEKDKEIEELKSQLEVRS